MHEMRILAIPNKGQARGQKQSSRFPPTEHSPNRWGQALTLIQY